MITLYASGPLFGQPDPSPFVTKAMMLLKMAGIPFEAKPMSFSKAPKGKIPYIATVDGMLGDTHFIKCHLEEKYGADFSGGYSKEEHFYFLIVHDRWVPNHNFSIGPAQYFNVAPAPIRPFIRSFIRSKILKMLHAQGIGRHSDAERAQLGRGDIEAIETLLVNKTFILGENISEYDATVFAFLFSAAATLFESEIGTDIRSRPRLMAYLERIRSAYFPECKL
jgi:glutathione S-transferase